MLSQMLRSEGWEGSVTLVSADMREWQVRGRTRPSPFQKERKKDLRPLPGVR